MTSGKLNFCEYKCGLSVCGFDLCRCYVDSIILLIYSGTVDHGGLLYQIVKLFHVIFNVSLYKTCDGIDDLPSVNVFIHLQQQNSP